MPRVLCQYVTLKYVTLEYVTLKLYMSASLNRHPLPVIAAGAVARTSARTHIMLFSANANWPDGSPSACRILHQAMPVKSDDHMR